ncbi:molybdopterin-binding protein [Streptomyces sp. NPDC054796]
MSGADELDEAIALANYRGDGQQPPPPQRGATTPPTTSDELDGLDGLDGLGVLRNSGPSHGSASGPAPDRRPGEPPERATPSPSSSRPGTGTGGGTRTGTGNAAPAQPAEPPQHSPRTQPPHQHAEPTTWHEAHALAARTGAPLGTVTLPLDRALHHTLAAPVTALTDLPSFDTSAMDGWAVSGPGPWELTHLPDAPGTTRTGTHTGASGARQAATPGLGILAGDRREPPPLADGHAIRIATGARIPPGASAVLRSEYGETVGGRLRTQRPPQPGTDIRPRGQECRSGDTLLPPGTPLTPPALGLSAAAGYDELAVVRRPRAEVLVLGDELLHRGLPRDGRIRDALGPMVGPWLAALGAEVLVTRRLGDDAEALHEAVATTTADLVVTTGGTASGPVDHLHPTLERVGARLLIDGVRVRPGHPMLLARLPGGQHLVGLPGNPLAALSGLVTLAAPLVRTLAGRPHERNRNRDRDRNQGRGRDRNQERDHGHAPEEIRAPLSEEVHGHPRDTRLVPVAYSPAESLARPLHYTGPAMLRGIATANALAVVPPGGATPGTDVQLLTLPW